MKRFIVQSQHPAFFQFIENTLEITMNPHDTRIVAHLGQKEDSDDVEILAVAAYNRWTPFSCELTLAADHSPYAFSRRFIRTVYQYAFDYAGVERINMTVDKRNVKMLEDHERLGHVKEGTIRDGFGRGFDGILYGFTRTDYENSKWYVGKSNK